MNHLNVILGPNPFLPLYFILRELFSRTIKIKLPGNRFSFRISGFSAHFSCTARRCRKWFETRFFQDRDFMSAFSGKGQFSSLEVLFVQNPGRDLAAIAHCRKPADWLNTTMVLSPPLCHRSTRTAHTLLRINMKPDRHAAIEPGTRQWEHFANRL